MLHWHQADLACSDQIVTAKQTSIHHHHPCYKPEQTTHGKSTNGGKNGKDSKRLLILDQFLVEILGHDQSKVDKNLKTEKGHCEIELILDQLLVGDRGHPMWVMLQKPHMQHDPVLSKCVMLSSYLL